MTRFDYLAAPRRRRCAAPRIALAIDARIRGPLAILAFTFLAVGALAAIGIARLHAEVRVTAALEERLATDAVPLAALLRERTRIARGAAILAHVAALRRSDGQRANELAWIGNRLPADTALRALRYEAGRYALEGTSRQVAAIGVAMLALRDADRGTIPHLVTLRANADGSPSSVNYELRLDATP